MSNMGVLRKTRRWVLPVAALILATGSTAASAAEHVVQKGKRTEAALAAPGAPIEPFLTCPNYGYMVTLPVGSGRSTYNRYDIGAATLIPIKQFDFVVNAIGYAPSPCMLRRLGLAADGQAPPPRDADGDGDVDGDALVVTGGPLRPYLLIGMGMVLLGLVILILALMMGPKKERKRI